VRRPGPVGPGVGEGLAVPMTPDRAEFAVPLQKKAARTAGTALLGSPIPRDAGRTGARASWAGAYLAAVEDRALPIRSQASRVAWRALSHSSPDLPRALAHPRSRSGSTSSHDLPAWSDRDSQP